MTPSNLTFDLTNNEENTAFAMLVRNFNEQGVPYKVSQNGTLITLEIGTGF